MGCTCHRGSQAEMRRTPAAGPGGTRWHGTVVAGTECVRDVRPVGPVIRVVAFIAIRNGSFIMQGGSDGKWQGEDYSPSGKAKRHAG